STSVSGRAAIVFLSIALTLASIVPAFAVDKPAAKGQKASSAAPESKDPNYWFQKGALCSTYGNNQAAIRYFGKAVTLDPNHSGAYFSQGISYGQLGNYSRAVADINRAIEMEPQNGLYYYGRGRTYLLAGEKDKALQDFRKAAELGDEDAQEYLKNVK
ncbi:MAG: tetratricopeptide repeat protein, partial [Hyphomicrobiales bacterium]